MGWCWFAMTLLTLASCSSSRKLPALNESQAFMLDSIPMLPGGEQAESITGKFRQHQCSFERDSVLQTDVIRLRWWRNENPAHSINLPWPDSTSQNLEEVEDIGGISLFIKKTGESQSDPVLVVEVADVEGRSSSISLSARHIPVFPIDTNWQEVRIPFTDFTRGRIQTDWSRIASMNLTMEHFGEVLIRDFVVVPHITRKKVERKARKRPPLETPSGRFFLFEENTSHVWGLGDFGENRRFTINSKRGRDKSLGLDMEWDFQPIPFSREPAPIPHHIVGFSWNGWQSVMPPEKPQESHIIFKLRNIGVNQGPSQALPIQVGVADAQGHRAMVELSQAYIPGETFGKWHECRVPLSAFDWSTKESPNGLGSIAYIFFQFSEKGHVYIDDLYVRF